MNFPTVYLNPIEFRKFLLAHYFFQRIAIRVMNLLKLANLWIKVTAVSDSEDQIDNAIVKYLKIHNFQSVGAYKLSEHYAS